MAVFKCKMCRSTTFAVANGTDAAYETQCCDWWLRSPGYYTSDATVVFDYGTIYDIGFPVHNDSCNAVRPAMWIEIK